MKSHILLASIIVLFSVGIIKNKVRTFETSILKEMKEKLSLTRLFLL